MGFQLTSENYYSDIANYEYMSVSQFNRKPDAEDPTSEISRSET